MVGGIRRLTRTSANIWETKNFELCKARLGSVFVSVKQIVLPEKPTSEQSRPA